MKRTTTVLNDLPQMSDNPIELALKEQDQNEGKEKNELDLQDKEKVLERGNEKKGRVTEKAKKETPKVETPPKTPTKRPLNDSKSSPNSSKKAKSNKKSGS